MGFRSYLYGSPRVIIFTDHQPLTFVFAKYKNKNHNGEIKRWKCIKEENNYELKDKAVKTTVVADSLDLLKQISTLSTVTYHSSDSSSHNLISNIKASFNVFKNQILLNVGPVSTYQFKIVFPTYHRHIIEESDYHTPKLISPMKRYMNSPIINCIKTDESIMEEIQEIYFKNYKVGFT